MTLPTKLAAAILLTLVSCSPSHLALAGRVMDVVASGARALEPVIGFCDQAGASQADVHRTRELVAEAIALSKSDDAAAFDKLTLAVSAVDNLVRSLESRGVDIPPDVRRAHRVVQSIALAGMTEGIDSLDGRLDG